MVDYKKLAIGLGALCFLSLTVIIALAAVLGNTSKNEKSEDAPKLCLSKSCINSANLILNNMNLAVDPCDDFNQFACGNFIKTKKIPDDSTSIDAFTDLRNNLATGVSDLIAAPIDPLKDIESIQNAKRFYQSCVDEATIEINGVDQLRKIINDELNGWPLLDNKYDPNEDILQKLVRFRKVGQSPFFNVYVSSNPTNPLVSIIRMDQAGWYSNKEFYADEKKVNAYKKLAKDVIGNLNPSVSNLDEYIDRMFNLEKEFAYMRLTVAEKRGLTYTRFNLTELNSKFPNFDFAKYIKELFAEFSQIKIEDDEIVLVDDLSYIGNASQLFKKQLDDANGKRDLLNLMGWAFVKDRLNGLPKVYRDASNEYRKVSSGLNTPAPRPRTCANAILDRMPYAVGRIYVANFFDETAKNIALEMIENIRKEFKVIVDESDWLDEISKKAVQEKADLIVSKIGYPDYTYNDTYMDKLYENYKFDTKTYFANDVLGSRNTVRESFSKLRDPRDRNRWISGPAIVNAFYSSELNQICFPAGILQQPFYDANVPKYLNYGGIGSVIGHEITHGFDDNGRKYDKNGVFVPDGTVGLWTNKTVNNYINKAQCIIRQYSNFRAEQVNLFLNGTQTQGENIADNGGIKESFRAYQKWAEQNGPEPLLPGLNFTQNQLFFINYAQVWCTKATDQTLEQRIRDGVHSPGEFRIRGPTSNTDFFSKTFNCKPKQANNPDEKCSVW